MSRRKGGRHSPRDLVDLVRPSRDGDQYHYLRAARLCLELIRPQSRLHRITIEGASTADDIRAGTDVIDMGLYFGAGDPQTADRVSYRQFKHSTTHSEEEWTNSGLLKTLNGFAARYGELAERFGEEAVVARFSFEFESNRSVSLRAINSLRDLANGTASTGAKYFEARLPLEDTALRNFASCVRILPRTEGYLLQRQLLELDFSSYLPDNDKDAPLQLKELVTRKATSEFETNPEISRFDVLSAIGASEQDLFPAPCLIEVPSELVDRVQLPSLMETVRSASKPVILQADGGVGKSVSVTQLERLFPTGSRVFVYDCFGNGGYRSPSGYRHKPREGLIQIANEMAAKGLCDPLIPTSKAEDGAYYRAFKARIAQASSSLSIRSGALIVIVIDAADNAEMQAAELQERPCFARELLRESWPANVRLVVTSRPHRVGLLTPPHDAILITLDPFTEDETAANVRRRFPSATMHDIREFHRLTSMNPRVQAAALTAGDTLPEVLAALGPTPRTVEDTIGALLGQAVAKARDAAGTVEQGQIDGVCAALATLRPFVPLQIVAAAAKVPVELVRSIAHDLQRPLLVREDAVQFRDEPTETWFRERFRPDEASLADFVARLLPFASSSAYVSAVLPQLMLEAGQFEELVNLALAGEALPEESPIARRDVELQRLQFALKAALRSGRFLEAGKLAMRAGGVAAADERQQKLLSANTDLASRFLEPNQILEQVSRRQIVGGNWTGSEHAYEAALLSGSPGLGGDARSRLRLAYDWVRHWSTLRRQDPEQHREGIEWADIAELVFAELNLHGAEVCARQLRSWRPRAVSFHAGRPLVRRLIDAGRFQDLDDLAIAARNDLCLLLAICLELSEIGRSPPAAALERALWLASSKRVEIDLPTDWRGDETRLACVNALVFACISRRVGRRARLASLLGRYLPKKPPHGLTTDFSHIHDGRFAYLRGYTLRAALRRSTIRLEALAHPELRKALKRNQTSHQGRDEKRFREDIGALLPWHQLWAEIQLGRYSILTLKSDLDRVSEESRVAELHSYRDHSATVDEIARIRSEILFATDAPQEFWTDFENWRANRRQPLFFPTLIRIARFGARGGRVGHALDLASEVERLLAASREHADSQAETYLELTRAVLSASQAEAAQYFDRAITIASKIGDENLSRWDSLLHLATAAGAAGDDDPETAYRFARAAELTYEFVARDKHFDWEHTIEALVALSPRSAFPVLSRWIDRRFGREDRLLPELVAQLVQRGALNPIEAIALLPMDGDWELGHLLEGALAAPDIDANKVEELFWRYARFLSATSKTWGTVRDVLERRGLDPSRAVARLERSEISEQHSESKYSSDWRSSRAEGTDWGTVFEGVDITTALGLTEAIERYRSLENGFYAEQFYARALDHIPDGSESDFLDALRGQDFFSFYEARGLFEVIPKKWLNRAATKAALSRLVRDLYRQNCFSVSAGRYYQTVSFELAASVSGLSREDLVLEAVNAIGSSNLNFAADTLFRLAGLLSIIVPANTASEALRYSLDLLDSELRPEDADGAWRPTLIPAITLEENLAGYLWASLASPLASRRWRSAHALRCLAALDQKGVLDALIKFAEVGAGGPFVDDQLRFYPLHGKLWFSIAMARAALESPSVIANYVECLRPLASRKNLHVLIRSFAADALLSLAASQQAEFTDGEIEALRSVNLPRLPPLRSRELDRDRMYAKPDRKYEDHRFFFGIDFPKYYLAPLGRLFGLSEDEMEVEAERVILDDWKLTDTGRYDADARNLRGFFRDDSRRARGEMSKADDLSFYLSYHSTMVVAGKLLEEKQSYEDEDDDWDTIARWMRDQRLARQDGLWLADRRDETPVDCESLPSISEKEWPTSLTSDIAEQIVTSAGHAVSIAGYWDTVAGRLRQSVSIRSALVTSSRTDALVRAITSTSDRGYNYLPDAGDDISSGDYLLKGLLSELGRDSGLDEYDPWAAGLSKRVFVPGSWLIENYGLSSDGADRIWRDAAGSEVFTSNVWSEGEDDDRSSFSDGKRLQVKRDWASGALRDLECKLILDVEVRRRVAFAEYEQRWQENVDGEPIKFLAIIEAEGPANFHQYGSRPRKKARSRARSRRHQ